MSNVIRLGVPVVLVFVGWVLTVCIHEFGHVLGGLIGRTRVRSVTVGRVGPCVAAHFGAIEVTIHVVPSSGRTEGSTTSRAQEILFIAGGPVASGVVAWLVFALAPQTDSLLGIALFVFGVMNAIAVVASLLPIGRLSLAGNVASDGWNIIGLVVGTPRGRSARRIRWNVERADPARRTAPSPEHH
jgi:hypothetical protein